MFILKLISLTSANQSINLYIKNLSQKLRFVQLDHSYDCNLKKGETNKHIFVFDKYKEVFNFN